MKFKWKCLLILIILYLHERKTLFYTLFVIVCNQHTKHLKHDKNYNTLPCKNVVYQFNALIYMML